MSAILRDCCQPKFLLPKKEEKEKSMSLELR
jgi:hypothetical protein